MPQSRYKWDVEELEYCMARLKQEREKLQSYVEQLQTLRGDINHAWTSFSQDIFDETMDLDAKSLQGIVDMLDNEIAKLGGVIEKDYTDCENKIAEKVRVLAANIRSV